MSTVLVVEDQPESRDFLVTLLGYKGYQVFEAQDGADALAMLEKQSADLVIADILMPTMDGFELVRRMRLDPRLESVPVIFYTASYHQQEAKHLATTCGAEVLSKPSDPETILTMVEESLRPAAKPQSHPLLSEFTLEHMRIVSDKLNQKVGELEGARQRLTTLLDFTRQMNSEYHREHLMYLVAQAARDLVGARFAGAGLLPGCEGRLDPFRMSGLTHEATAQVCPPRSDQGVMARLIGQNQPLRMPDIKDDPLGANLPPPHKGTRALLGTPIRFGDCLHGILYAIEKLGNEEFGEEDEDALRILAAQVSVWCENAIRVEELRKQAYVLDLEVRERQRAEEELRKLSCAVEQSPTSIMIAAPTGEIEYVNPQFTRVTGYSLEEVRGKSPRILKSGETPAEEYKRLWETITRGGTWQGEFHNKKKNGELFWEHATISPIVDQAGRITHFLAVKEDITSRKRSDELLRRHDSLFDQSYDAVLVWDWEGPLTFWNRGAERIYGFPREEILGKSPHALLDTKIAAGLDAVLGALERDSRWEGEMEQVTRDGRRIRLESRMTLVRESGSACVLEVNRDITDRQLLEKQLRQGQKMEAIGRLAGGVAHDFNNLLGVILGYSSLLLDAVQEPVLHKKVQEINKAGERAAGLTRQLLAFSRQQVLEPKVLDLNAVLKEAGKMLPRLIGEDVDLAFKLGSGLAGVRLDEGQIIQVLMNLAVNARDAMPDGGQLTIETANITLDETYAQGHPAQISPGDYVLLAVSDTGIGMDAEIQAKIFEPFFTTKEKGKGTGLGLATVYGIVKQSAGFIWLYSEPGQGSTFKLYFPQVKNAVTDRVAVESPGEVPHGSETVLLAEDEQAMREITAENLTECGYRVLAADNGAHAMEIAAQHDGPIHLLLTDVVMPGMNGSELAKRIQACRPDTKVLFISGYAGEAIVRHGISGPGAAFLQKPFSRYLLARKIRELLGATNAKSIV